MMLFHKEKETVNESTNSGNVEFSLQVVSNLTMISSRWTPLFSWICGHSYLVPTGGF